MATGDLTVFDEAKLALLNGTHDSDTNTMKVALIDNTAAPTAGDTTPAWGDYSANEVSGTNYTAGGETMTVSLTEAAGTVTFDFTTNPTWTQHASGFTDAYWAIIYDDTATSDEAIAFVEMGGPVSLVSGDVSITWNDSGVFTLA